jgi:hypothetical protein
LTHYRRQTGLFERCGRYSPTACKLHTPVGNFRIVHHLTDHLLSTSIGPSGWSFFRKVSNLSDLTENLLLFKLSISCNISNENW